MSGKLKDGRERVGFARPDLQAEPAEDEDTARLITRFQAGDDSVFAALYSRYFDRIYGYLRIALRDRHEAEDMAQQVFMKAFESLRSYEMRRPFRAWLFTVARNTAISSLRKQSRSETMDPAKLAERSKGANEEAERWALSWISDHDLAFLVERLPVRQRQVLALRYLLDLRAREVAAIMDCSENEVRMLQHRAQKFLRERLAALGREPKSGERVQWQGRKRQAIVLRERRYILGQGPQRPKR
jgi:RNA polymerase sigma-70 factor (ECF subfamily)